ncbi:MAG TPA: hypothetical protein VHD83_19150 [Puia sp.]|nr:hypothetical protein [Puia sp.]
MKKPLKFTLIGLGIFIMIGIIGAAIDGSHPKTGSSSNSDASGASTSSNTPQRSYVKLLEFSGNGKKKSIVFELHGNHARFKYKYKSEGSGMGFFSVYVTPDGEDVMETGGIPEVMSTADHEQSESAIQRSAGKYYLDVNAAGSWSIVVEEEQ